MYVLRKYAIFVFDFQPLNNFETMNIQPMTKKQLALAYAPGLSVGGAANRLCHWLHYNPRLMDELRQTGYRESQHLLTARQVEIIFRHLGEP